ncbi:MAG: BrnT family toxin [Burkholderiales bacterium]|nr:BrnT family toxin [Burkholderiales bacterium]
MIKFEWDPAKAGANLKKHGVSFEEAQSVFYDEFAVQFFDEKHSSGEERFLLLGMSTGAKLLLVCHCERDAGHVIRIISARKATRRESAFYRGEQS